MQRDRQLKKLTERSLPWDMIIIGGGVTGAGIALDAASRGYAVCLFEQSDFGKGTSSRSTKLIHGGVRYLEQGNIPLVIESLHERGLLHQNAPHLVRKCPFIVPEYSWWEGPFYGIGMKVYDLLAGKYGFGKSEMLSKSEVLKHIPTLNTDGLLGGVVYYDGQFDDARLLINIIRTAVDEGAVVVNGMSVTGIQHNHEGMVSGVSVLDRETGREYNIYAHSVINATGPLSDSIRKMEGISSQQMIAPSQGTHIVLPKKFLPGDAAIMVPHTRDGRLMFAIPWHGTTLLGTTDTPLETVSIDPVPLESEIDFILETAAPYLANTPTRKDILSVFAGIRPLVRSGSGRDTAALSRDFVIDITSSGLITVAGGKWTTYRKMAEECVDQAAILASLESRPCVTKTLNIHGYHQHPEQLGVFGQYGSDAMVLEEWIGIHPDWKDKIHPDLPITIAEVLFAIRCEMARTLDDILSRRTRATFLNIKAAIESIPLVLDILSDELGRDEIWKQEEEKEFRAIAQGFLGHK